MSNTSNHSDSLQNNIDEPLSDDFHLMVDDD